MPLCLVELPRELLEEVYPHVDIPFALRITCRALRDAFTDPLVALFNKRIRGRVCDNRAGGHKTKTAMVDLVKSAPLAKWAFECGIRYENLMAQRAAAGGYTDALQYLVKVKKAPLHAALPKLAAEHGHLQTLAWMHKNGAFRAWTQSTCDGAAANGHFKCLEFAFNRNCPFSNEGLNVAARNGHYVCVEFMLMQNAMDFRWNRDNCRACEHAARGGHIRVLQLLREFRIGWSTDATEACARGGHVDCMEWMLREKCPIDYRYCFDDAARDGHIHMLHWIAARWTPNGPAAEVYFHDELLEDLAGTGHIPVLELAKEWGATFEDDSFVTIAAHDGHLDTIKWLVEQGAPLDPEALPGAASTGGNLDVLNWVAEQPDMVWGNDTFDGAIQSLHVHVLEWAYNTKRVDGPWANDRLAQKVSRWGNLEMGKWLVDNGFVWGEIATRSNLKMAQELAKYIEADTPSA